MNILLTSAGRRTYLIDYFKNAMQGIGKVYAANSEYTYSLSHADGYVLTPLIYDDEYVSFLINYCVEHDITAIISLFDIDLFVLAENKVRFERSGIHVIVSDENAIATCNDKWQTYVFLQKNRIDCPKTFNSIDDVRNALNSKEVSFPIIVKPRWGMGSIGIFVADNEKELEIFAEKVHKQIFSSYLKYESKQDVSKCVLFQEKIIGQEYGLDILNDLNKNYVTAIAKKKISMRAGETDVAEIVDCSSFVELSKSLSLNLPHVANLDVDVFKTEDGRILVLELNCRFGGQYPFSHLAGVDFPKQIVEWR